MINLLSLYFQSTILKFDCNTEFLSKILHLIISSRGDPNKIFYLSFAEKFFVPNFPAKAIREEFGHFRS